MESARPHLCNNVGSNAKCKLRLSCSTVELRQLVIHFLLRRLVTQLPTRPSMPNQAHRVQSLSGLAPACARVLSVQHWIRRVRCRNPGPAYWPRCGCRWRPSAQRSALMCMLATCCVQQLCSGSLSLSQACRSSLAGILCSQLAALARTIHHLQVK